MFKVTLKMRGFLLLLVIYCLNVRFLAGTSCDENSNKLAVANNHLGVKLYHKLTENTPENIFFSPLSLSTAFGMLYVGTRGNSAKQLRNVLGYSTAELSSDEVPSAFNQYLSIVLQENENENKAYDLNLADEILFSESFNVNSDYIEEVESSFKAKVEKVDFASNTHEIVEEVNDWVSQQTHGKIEKFLTELSPSTLFLILNAVYFKGTWQTKFNKTLTTDGVFYNNGQDPKNVPFMHIQEKFPYFSNSEYEVVELPYKGEDISMIILLPLTQDGLQSVEEQFTAEDIKTIQEKLVKRKITLSLPKFTVGYSREMSSDFEALGAEDIFNSGVADLSGITQGTGLFVNQVIHKAVIEVNEDGSVAAATTGIIGTRTMVPSVIVNHPFLFMILDKRNSLVLFMGRVNSL